ncbi:unnamed protein product [Closterium sp. Naga37s-1]|nr:unnamed protein product [Closterium sp. Naga37s-1]
MATSRIALPAIEFPLQVPVGIGGYMVTLEMKDYEVLRDEKAEFTEPCFDLGLAYELDRLGKGDRMILIRGASLRAARTASKPDYLVFGSAFGFEALAIPLCTGGGPLPGRHCSVLLVVRPGDLLLPDEEEIGTFYRHLDPKTSSKRHEEEVANVLRFFGECVKAELNREGRQWTAAPPSAEVLSERLESLAAPIRDKLPDILKEEVAGTGLLAVNAFAWSLEHLDDLVHHVEKAASNKGEAASTVGRGVGTGIALGGEAEEAATGSHSGGHGPADGGKEEHEREDEEGGGEQDGGSEEEEDKEREGDDVVVTGEEEAVQFAGEKVADKSGGSGPKSGEKARGSGGSTPTRMASKAAIERLKAAEREIKKLREEKLVAEKRLEFQMARNDTIFGVVTSAVNKLTTVAEGVTHHEQTSRRSLQMAVDAMKAVVQEAVTYRGSTLEFMNTQWLPTVQALHLTATAAQGRRREDDLLLFRGVADALGEKIKTVMSAEVKAAMEGEAQGIAAAVTAKVVQELRDDLVKAVTSATQQGIAQLPDDLLRPAALVGQQGGPPGAGQHLHPSTSTVTAQDARPAGVTALVDELLRPAAVVGQQGGPPGAGQHPPTATSPATAQDARPAGATALVDELLRPAVVVGQHVQQAAAGQHPHTATSPATAHDARPGGVTALVDELLRPAAVVGQHVQQAAAGQHPHTATSPATAHDARPGGVTALVDELLRPAAASASSGRPGGVTAQLVDQSFRPDLRATTVLPSGAVKATSVIVSTTTAAPTKSGTARATLSLPNPPPPTTGTAGAASLPVHGAMVAAEPIPIPTAVESRAVKALITQKPSFDEYLKWLEDQGQKTPVIPPTHSNQAVNQGAVAANVAAATAGPSGSTVEAAVWRATEEAGGVDEEILASIVMPDPEIEVMREKLHAAAPTVGAQQGTPAASTAPAEDHRAAGAKSPPATTCEVGNGKQKRKGKDKAKGGPAKAGSSKGTSKAAAQGRKGSGVRVDPSNGLATSEMKFGKKSRYICRSMDKSEAAYCIAVAVSSFDGFVSDVVLDEFGGVKEEVMAQYKADWNVARLIPGGMWMVMWSRGANVFRDRADRAALMLALRPAVWFGDLPESTEPEKAAKNKVASDMVARVSMCAAFAPVAAKVTPIPGVGSERLSEILAGTAAAVWCFSETNATAEVAAGEGGAAATVRGASNEFARRCRTVIEAVLQRAASRVVGVGEVAETVTKDLQAAVVRSLPEVGEEREHDELIARVMIENLAFWGDCNVGGPKLKARGVVLPIDPQMKIIIRDRGARGQQHKGKQVADA